MKPNINKKSKNPFSDAVKIANAKQINLYSSQSINWYRQYVKNNFSHINHVDNLRNIKDVSKRQRFMYGRIYTFIYDPKYKQKLPYYDSCPLIIPYSDEGKTFLAFNLHYLPLRQRGMLLDMLYKINNSNGLDGQKIRLTHAALTQMKKSKYFEPCIKRYLKSHVRSKFNEFKQEHWEIAAFLPLANFHKASAGQVHADSLQKVQKAHRKN